jgi:hypothetical protein
MPACIDNDNDSYGVNCSAGADCDDNNSSVHPGAAEMCNGIDDDCDGQTDEGCTACVDNDSDGYGVNCSAGTDCDDNNSAIHAPVSYYRDADGDGYGDADNASEFCSLTAPAGFVTDNADCDDTDDFLYDICPDCTVKVIPKALGWFLGEKQKNRTLLVIGKKGTVFDANTAVRWETDAIKVLSRKVFFKRFMLMKVSIDGAALDKGEYRALIGECTGKLTLVK